MLGVCGIRIAWIEFVFPQSRTFRTIMTVYPVSLSSTMLLILAALICFRPSRRFALTGRGRALSSSLMHLHIGVKNIHKKSQEPVS